MSSVRCESCFYYWDFWDISYIICLAYYIISDSSAVVFEGLWVTLDYYQPSSSITTDEVYWALSSLLSFIRLFQTNLHLIQLHLRYLTLTSLVACELTAAQIFFMPYIYFLSSYLLSLVGTQLISISFWIMRYSLSLIFRILSISRSPKPLAIRCLK